MDRTYRRQRHVYDATRALFLTGRDSLLRGMNVRPGDRVLEVGCGTGRNLVRLAGMHPAARLYGLDASGEMLKTARAKLRRAGLDGKVPLAHCLAEDFDRERVFGLDEPFDVVLFSYALTMMPGRLRAVDAALAGLRPGGSIHIVDFWDGRGLPSVLRVLLARWLALFGVEHRDDLGEHLRELARRGEGSLALDPLAGRYAFLARFRKAGSQGGERRGRTSPCSSGTSYGQVREPRAAPFPNAAGSRPP
jgi:S-adenosylmethionine-diacylgycerolhomoserine-N-methlytransferase